MDFIDQVTKSQKVKQLPVTLEGQPHVSLCSAALLLFTVAPGPTVRPELTSPDGWAQFDWAGRMVYLATCPGICPAS